MATTPEGCCELGRGSEWGETGKVSAMYRAWVLRVIGCESVLGALDDLQTKELFDTHSTAIELLHTAINGLHGSRMGI